MHHVIFPLRSRLLAACAAVSLALPATARAELILHYSFEPGTFDHDNRRVWDQSGSNNHAGYGGENNILEPVVDPERGHVYEMAGRSLGIINDNGVTAPGAFTVAGWYKGTGPGYFFDQQDSRIVFSVNWNSDQDPNDGGASAGLGIYDGSGDFINTGHTTFNNNTWQHVAFVIDNDGTQGFASIYVDGQAIDMDPVATGVQTVHDLPGGILSLTQQSIDGRQRFAAKYDGSAPHLNGRYDDLAIFNEALTPGKAGALYGLSAEQDLDYDPGQAQSLFDVYDAVTPQAIIDGHTWVPTSAGMLNGAPGDIVSLGNGDYGLVLDGHGGGVATRSGNLQSYRIDLDSTAGDGGPIETAPGWVSLNVADGLAANSSSVTINGIEFQPFSASGSRIRRDTSGPDPNPNPLTGDFIYEDANSAAVGLFFGEAGDLKEGWWEVEMYIWDAHQGENLGNSIVGYRENDGGGAIEHIISNLVAPNAEDAAIKFSFYSDGLSAYDVFVRENNDGNRARLNAVSLTYVPEPSTYALFGLGLLGILARHRRRVRRG